MKKTNWISCLTAATMLAGLPAVSLAQDGADRPSREALREQLKDLSPEERAARIRELREKHGQDQPRPQLPPNLREQLRNLPPEEREAKLKELREQHGARPANPEFEKIREELKNLSPEEREAKIKELREKFGARPGGERFGDLTPEQRKAKMEERLAELQKKKADGTITPQEQQALDHMEAVSKRINEHGARPKPGPAPAPEKSADDK